MKFYDSKGVETIITWGDHWPGYDKCREVSIEKSATFANVCAQGAPLLSKELVKRQAPAVKKKRSEVLGWAQKAGVFPMGKSANVKTKYTGES